MRMRDTPSKAVLGTAMSPLTVVSQALLVITPTW